MIWLLLGAEARQMGKIVGGWEYVWACYLLTWAGIVIYAATLFLRYRAQAAKNPSITSAPKP